MEAHVNSIVVKLRLVPAPDDYYRVRAVLTFLEA